MVCVPVRRDNPRALAGGLSIIQAHKPALSLTCTTFHRYPIFSTRYSVMCKVYTGYCGTSEIEHGLCACTVDNPLAKARGLSLRTGAQPMIYLPLISSPNHQELFIRFTVRVSVIIYPSVCFSFSSGFLGGRWDLTVLMSDHCPSFYFLFDGSRFLGFVL